MTQVDTVLLAQDDWQVYRALRLAALTDAPAAFGSTLALEQKLGERDWRDRLRMRAQFVTFVDGAAAGTAGGIVNGDSAEVVSMWVDPRWRGRGIGDLLMRALLDWAADRECRGLMLWVAEGNEPAERLYLRHDFVRTGDVKDVLAGDPSRREFAMTRATGT